MTRPRFATTANRKRPRKLKKHHHWMWGGPVDGWELYFPPTSDGLPSHVHSKRWSSFYVLTSSEDVTPFYEWRGAE